MRSIIILLIITQTVFGIRNVIGNYIFDDIATKTLLKSRTSYLKSDESPWQFSTNVAINTNFPRLKSYLNINPNITFEAATNHLDEFNSTSRMVESYVDIYTDFGIFSIGNQRLSFQQGQFISDASFSLIKRSFSQLSFQTLNQQLKIFRLMSVTDPDSTTTHFFNKGSYIMSFSPKAYFDDLISTDVTIFLIEDHSDTYFIGPKLKLNLFESIQSNFGFQKSPSLFNGNQLKKNAFYYDLAYVNQYNFSKIKLGTRYFSSGINPSDQFSAPYSSGHSWDGYLNIYQNNVKNGFSTSYQSIYGELALPLSGDRRLIIEGYLFRNGNFTENKGAEIDFCLSDQIFSDNIIWTYKISQYISGNASSPGSELGMWLDFSVQMDNRRL